MLARDLARDDRHRAVLAERPGRREDDAVDDAPADGREGDAPEGLHAGRPERRGGLLLLGAHLAQHGHHLAHHERQADEDRGEDHAGQRRR